MWAGFFAWYRGLAIGGALRVSQTQLLQPFFSILAAVPLLGEALEPMTLGFALGVVAVVFLGKRFAGGPAASTTASATARADTRGALSQPASQPVSRTV
jgi:drug/metabolite transporter (DMT)-like permease